MSGKEKSPRVVLVETILPAVYGRGKATCRQTYEIELDNYASQILGSHIANQTIVDSLTISGLDGSKKVDVTGNFDLFLWCKAQSDTFVTKTTIHFTEEVPVGGIHGIICSNEVANATVVGHPTCEVVGLAKRGNKQVVQVEIAQNLAVEVVGDARLLVHAAPLSEGEGYRELPVQKPWREPEAPEEDYY